MSIDDYRNPINLTDAFRNTPLLSVDDKTTGASFDTIQAILSRSRVFRFLAGSMLLWIALEAMFAIVMLNLPFVDATLRPVAIVLFAMIIIVGFPIWTLICLPFSRKLR